MMCRFDLPLGVMEKLIMFSISFFFFCHSQQLSLDTIYQSRRDGRMGGESWNQIFGEKKYHLCLHEYIKSIHYSPFKWSFVLSQLWSYFYRRKDGLIWKRNQIRMQNLLPKLSGVNILWSLQTHFPVKPWPTVLAIHKDSIPLRWGFITDVRVRSHQIKCCDKPA